MEAVPFEIMGEKNSLEEKYSIVYLSSLLSGLKRFNKSEKFVNIVENKNKNINNHLERIAIYESGIRHKSSGLLDSNICHLHIPVTYHKLRKNYILEISLTSMPSGIQNMYIFPL